MALNSTWLDHALDSVAQRMHAAGHEPIGYRSNGRPIWPILGASGPTGGGDGGGAGGQGGSGAGGSGGSSGGQGSGQGGSNSGGGQGAAGDKGFPEGTPLEQMTAEQQINYWKHYSRQHEERNRAYNGITPEQVAAFKEKADRHDALEHELMSDKDKAVADARTEATNAARAELIPELVQARFEAAAGGRLTAEQIQSILAPLDKSYFVNQAGKVDTDKVKAYVDQIAPAKGTQQGRNGPTATGHGTGPGTRATGKAGDAGRAEAQRRFGAAKQQQS